MFIKQISVFIENKKNRLADLTGLLASKSVNLHSLSIADTTDFGVVRLIVEDVDLAMQTLKEAGLIAKTTDVIAVSLKNNPGELSLVLRELADLDISIEYMYAFASHFAENEAIVVLRLDEQDKAVKKLEKNSSDILHSFGWIS